MKHLANLKPPGRSKKVRRLGQPKKKKTKKTTTTTMKQARLITVFLGFGAVPQGVAGLAAVEAVLAGVVLLLGCHPLNSRVLVLRRRRSTSHGIRTICVIESIAARTTNRLAQLTTATSGARIPLRLCPLLRQP